MNIFPQIHRHSEIRRVRINLERNSFPRMQMLLLVTITGISGFIASYSLLKVGIVDMWIRYLVSFGIAYLVFLLLLWLWLRSRAEDYDNLPDFSGTPSSDTGNSDSHFSGKGGSFGGGGANSSFDTPSANFLVNDATDSSSIGDALSTAAEAEEFAIPLMILVLFGALLFSSVFMIYSAPALFAEILVDGVLSASLYRRLRDLEKRHWLETAIRRTAVPFVLTAVVVSASGWGMALYAAGAHSIGDVISY